MIEEITFSDLIELPDRMLEKNAKIKYSTILEKSDYEKYDVKLLKSDIEQHLERFQRNKCFFNVPTEDNIKLTPAYVLRDYDRVNNINDPVSNLITRKADEQHWLVDFYNKIMDLATILTYDETVYFINTFFSKYSEETI